MSDTAPNAQPVPFPDQRLPRLHPSSANANVWIKVDGVWRAGAIISWVKVGDEWHCWTRHDDPAHPIHGHHAWYRYNPATIPAAPPTPRQPPEQAGNSASTSGVAAVPSDHPRVRGEQTDGQLALGHSTGPSPRAQGAASLNTNMHGSFGTIPTRAGSSPDFAPCTINPWDHPRVRGEQDWPMPKGPEGRGPSPRARGAGTPNSLPPRRRGTIPACAGSSARTPTPTSRPGDHPRVRGEQPGRSPDGRGFTGPSPRARGAADR